MVQSKSFPLQFRTFAPSIREILYIASEIRNKNENSSWPDNKRKKMKAFFAAVSCLLVVLLMLFL